MTVKMTAAASSRVTAVNHVRTNKIVIFEAQQGPLLIFNDRF